VNEELICASLEILYCYDPRKPSRIICRMEVSPRRTISLSRTIEGKVTPSALAEAIRDLAKAIEAKIRETVS
jgi:DNA-binding transcriptional regulator YdaS (Cro superfamily)